MDFGTACGATSKRYKLRICIDPSKGLDKAFKKPIYTMPTIEDVLPRLANAKVFSTVDGTPRIPPSAIERFVGGADNI